MRRFLGLIAGIAVTILVIMAIERVGHAAQPMPEMVDASDAATLVARTPLWLKLMVIAGYFLGTLAGAWTALRIGGWVPAVWIIGALFAVAGVATVLQFPHPMWMQAGSVLAPLLGSWAALHLSGRRGAIDPGGT